MGKHRHDPTSNHSTPSGFDYPTANLGVRGTASRNDFNRVVPNTLHPNGSASGAPRADSISGVGGDALYGAETHRADSQPDARYIVRYRLSPSVVILALGLATLATFFALVLAVLILMP